MYQIHTAINLSFGRLSALFLLCLNLKKRGYTLLMRKVSQPHKGNSGTPILVVGSSAKSGLSMLDGYEFSATACPYPGGALEMLSQGRHQVVLCDLEMPGMSGMVLVNSVSAGFPDVAVVVVTPPGKLRHGVLAMIAGSSGYVQKPLQPETVVASLRRALKRKQFESAMRGYPLKMVY